MSLTDFKTSPEWKEFERLVTRIEQAVAPVGAVVKSPDSVPDKDTGKFREVDATIRYSVGTVPILITLECRHRTKVPDIRWIEEIAQKKQSIGASMTVAVSSNGISVPATEKAKHLGIEVRTLTNAKFEDFFKWLQIQEVELTINNWSFLGLGIEPYDATKDLVFGPAMQELFREKKTLAPIFIRNSDKKGFHIENLLIEWRKHHGSLVPTDMPLDEKPRECVYKINFPRGAFHVETTTGPKDVCDVYIKLVFKRTHKRVPINTLAQYSNPIESIIQAAEWKLDDHNTRLSVFHDVKTGKTHFRTSTLKP